MADTDYGLGPDGFRPAQLPEIVADLQAQMQLQFGNVDLSDQSVFGQLIGIFAASSAQLWQAGAALYASSFPSGATGVAVDNILALNNLTRLGDAATVTDPTPVTQSNGVVLYGLRLLGAPGTVVPAGTLVSNGAATPTTFSLDAEATIAPASNARQVLYFSDVATTGSYSIALTSPTGAQATTAAIPAGSMARGTRFTWNTPPNSTYTLVLGGAGATSALAPTASAADVQAAIGAVQGFAGTQVTGDTTQGFRITWPTGYVPMLTATGSGAPTSIRHATSAYVHAALSQGTAPFTDVALADGAQSLIFDFGAFAPQAGAPGNAAAAVPRMQVAATTLATAAGPINVAPQIVVVGSPAQAIGSATATKTGAFTVLAGQLTTIATPVSGMTGVTNDLDCITGRSMESDSEAIARFRSQQGSSASGSLGSIVKSVKAVKGVSQVVAFQNTSNAAGQVLLFASAPTAGAWSILLGGQSTALLPYNATADDVQAAVRALAGFEATQVTAYGAQGYQFDFAGARGAQALALMGVAQNTTQVALTPYYGRPPHSVELVIEGGSEKDITAAILAATPAGIGLYANPSQRTLASIEAGKAQMTVASATGVSVGETVDGAGLPLGVTVVALAENVVTLSAAATASGSMVPVSFAHAPRVKDAAGNVLSVGYSRPTAVLINVLLRLVTDVYLKPGDSSSGRNSASQWDPGQVAGIQAELAALINATPIGGVISARGTNGLVGSFRDVVGLYDFELYFDRTPNPTNTGSLQLQSNEAANAQLFAIQVVTR